MRVLTVDHPAPVEIWRMLVKVGEVLGVDYCIRIGNLYEFQAGGGRCVRLTPESAGRVRLDLWRDGDVLSTLWRPAGDLEQLACAVAWLQEGSTERVV